MLGSRRDTRPPSKPGWYPEGEGRLRYFDGCTWTELVRQRPSLAHFASELPPAEVSSRPPGRHSRPLIKIASLLVVALLLGGVVAQLVILSISGNSPPRIASLGSYRRAADSICVSVFDGVSVTALERETPKLMSTKLSQSASAFGVLASEADSIPVSSSIAARWSDLAIDWSRYRRDNRANRASVVNAMRALDSAVDSAGARDCAVFTGVAQRGVLA